MSEGSAEPNITNLWSHYEKAQAQWIDANQKLVTARENDNWAQNQLNAAQKALDKFFERAKSRALPGSDWARENYQKARSNKE